MSHSSSTESQSSGLRWVLALLVIATVGFGFWGGWLHEHSTPKELPDAVANGGRLHGHPKPGDPLDAVATVGYHALQLLIGHGHHLHGPLPWQLHLGRWLGVLSLLAVGLIAFTRFFREEMLLLKLRMPWCRKHVVVCGLGDLGMRVALDGRRRRKFVIAIDKNAPAAAVERARRDRVLVLPGDASDPAILRRLRLRSAEFVVAACEHDSTNVAIAAMVRRLLLSARPRRRPLVCRLMVRDPEVRQRLEKDPLFSPDKDYYVNFSDLHLEEVAARQAFRLNPLDIAPIGRNDDTLVHLVVVGFGAMGRSLTLQAARVGHFANNALVKDRRISITVVDERATSAVSMLRQEQKQEPPMIDDVCQLDAMDVELNENAIMEALKKHRQGISAGDLVTYAVCLETMEGGPTPDDRLNFLIGMAISRTLASRPAQTQTLIYQSTRSGFGALFFPGSGDGDDKPRVRAFGMTEDIFTWDTLLRESEDQLARAVHEDYAENRRREGGQEKSWEDLTDTLKNSNRCAADHIPIKLRAIGCYDAPIQPSYKRILACLRLRALQPSEKPVEVFNPEETLLMAQMEHRRWCAERWLDGWKRGPVTDRAKKTNMNLVPWDEIPEKEQNKDPEQIRAIPRVLRLVGRAVYSNPRVAPTQIVPNKPPQQRSVGEVHGPNDSAKANSVE